MPPEDALDARLRRRWAKRGGGPELERRLKAAEAELARRANVETAERRGVRVPETSRVPVSDPTTGPTPRASSRPSVGTAEDSAARVEHRRSAWTTFWRTRALTRSQTRRAAASDGPRSGGIRTFSRRARSTTTTRTTRREPWRRGVTWSRTRSSRAHRRLSRRRRRFGKCFGFAAPAADERARRRKIVGSVSEELKAAANEALAENDVELANALYDEAIDRLSAFRENGGDDTGRRYGDEAEQEAKNSGRANAKKSPANRADDLTAVFLSNRARCKLLLRPPDAHGAVEDAERAWRCALARAV